MLLLQTSPESKVIWILQQTLICLPNSLNTHQESVTLDEPSHILAITAYKPRKDINIYKSHGLESTFIEIINQKVWLIIWLTLGIVFRHPKIDLNEFNDKYMNKLLDNITKKNKTIFLLGDLNIGFLNFWILSPPV